MKVLYNSYLYSWRLFKYLPWCKDGALTCAMFEDPLHEKKPVEYIFSSAIFYTSIDDCFISARNILDIFIPSGEAFYLLLLTFDKSVSVQHENIFCYNTQCV